VSSNDAFLFLALGYSIASLVIRWNSFSTCKYPLQLFLIVNYASIILFRSVRHLADCIGNQTLIKSVEIFKIVIVYPFFAGWTITGTIWFALDRQCAARRNQVPTFIIWFILCYIWISILLIYDRSDVLVGYAALIGISLHLGVFEYVFFAGEDADELQNPLLYPDQRNEGFSAEQISSIPSFVIGDNPEQPGTQCAICIEPFASGEKYKVLNPCGHSFHQEHIDEWLLRKPTCPLCRAGVVIGESA